VIEGGSTQQVLYVSRDGGLRYVAAFVARPGDAGAALPGDAAVLNQRSFIFEPQVLAIRDGQLVRFTNDDPANHNVRSDDAAPSNRFSLFTGYGERAERRFRSQPADRPIAVGCDIHPWMRAWLYVFNHPSFAVTSEAGRFHIDHVPIGRHMVSFRQPAGGLQRDVGVEVVAARTATLEVVFTAGDLTPQEGAAASGSDLEGRLGRAGERVGTERDEQNGNQPSEDGLRRARQQPGPRQRASHHRRRRDEHSRIDARETVRLGQKVNGHARGVDR
jgi:plastocyanin